MVNYLYYLDEQPLSMPIFIPPNATTITGYCSCNDDGKPCTEDINNYPWGEKCWTTNKDQLSFEYKFKGECFEVHGNHIPGGDLTAYSIYLDGVLLFQLNQAAEPAYLLDYTSIIVPYGLHTIKAEGTQGQKFEIFRLAYWLCVGAKRINATELLVTGGEWRTESDGFGGVARKNYGGGILLMEINIEKI